MLRLTNIALALAAFLYIPSLDLRSQDKKPSQLSDAIRDARNKLAPSNNLETRSLAVQDLENAADQIGPIVNTLITQGLKDPDDSIRMKSVRALGKFGRAARGAMDPLILVLETEKNNELRIAAASALGSIYSDASLATGEWRVVRALMKLIRQDKDTHVRWAACYSLRLIGVSAHEAAGELLEVITATDDDRLRGLARTSFLSVVGPSNSNLTPTLIEMYKKGTNDPDLDHVLIVGMGKIGASEQLVLPLLTAAIKDKKPAHLRLRPSAVEAIGFFGSKAKGTVPLLIQTLEESLELKGDERLGMCLACLQSLGNIGPDARAALPLVKMIAENPDFGLLAPLAKSALDSIHKSNK